MKRKTLLTILLIYLFFNVVINTTKVNATDRIVNSEATITFIDRSTIPNGSKGVLSGLVVTVSQSNVKKLPQTDTARSNVLYNIIGGELITLSILVINRRKRKEENNFE